MARSKIIAALLVAGVGLGGCSDYDQRINTSLNSVNQPVVQRTDYVFDLGSAGGGVSQAEQARLASWFESLNLGYGDRISIDQSAGYDDPQARQAVQEVASAYGLIVQEGAPITAGALQPGTVRVVVSRTSASVPGCPNWGTPMGNGPVQTSPNFGCSVNANLAAMVADPNDLVLGQSGSAAGDPAVAARAIRVYRNAQPTGTQGLQETNTRQQGGN